MAKRMLHTDIWKSKQVSSLSIQARLLFVGLITLGDDDGRLKGDAALLRSEIFPRDAKVTVQDVTKWLGEIVKIGLVLKYEADGEEYLAHPNWTRYQTLRSDRRKESHIPAPPVGLVPTVGQPDGNHSGAQDKEREEKARKEKELREAIDMGFQSFWKDYPNKTAKKKAQESWERVMREKTNIDQFTVLLRTIFLGLERAKKSQQWLKDGGQYIPHPTTWLNQARWNDEGTAVAPAKPTTHKI